LIVSDGTSTIYFYNISSPGSFIKKINVNDKGTPIGNLNELEYINGTIYSNIWYSDKIVIIDPLTGNVTGWIEVTGLKEKGYDVLNGIAYDNDSKKLYITGKKWSKLYEIELIPKNLQ